MKKIVKLACLSVLCCAAVANADPSCNDFKIIVKNNLGDLRVKDITLMGATIQPGHMQTISGNSEVVFTVSDITGDMHGQLLFQMGLGESKKIELRFDLKNKAFSRCAVDDFTAKVSGGVPIDSNRGINKITYTLG